MGSVEKDSEEGCVASQLNQRNRVQFPDRPHIASTVAVSSLLHLVWGEVASPAATVPPVGCVVMAIKKRIPGYLNGDSGRQVQLAVPPTER